MSFELAVMNVQKSITSAEAGELYAELCEGNVDVVASSENIDSFYQELTSKYPDIARRSVQRDGRRFLRLARRAVVSPHPPCSPGSLPGARFWSNPDRNHNNSTIARSFHSLQHQAMLSTPGPAADRR
jgi:hypothetical protein